MYLRAVWDHTVDCGVEIHGCQPVNPPLWWEQGVTVYPVEQWEWVNCAHSTACNHSIVLLLIPVCKHACLVEEYVESVG